MAKIYFNARDEMTCVDTDLIAVVQAEGNYSRVVYITKREFMLSQGISKIEEILHAHRDPQTRFVRLGRSVLVNHRYLYKIDIMKQLVILSDGSKEEIRLHLPKPIVKTYKKAIAMSLEKKGGIV
jgi:DNA-binding LytR/AlgR family response regulator